MSKLSPEAVALIAAQGCACTGEPCGQHVCPERYAEEYVPPEPAEFPDNGPSESF